MKFHMHWSNAPGANLDGKVRPIIDQSIRNNYGTAHIYICQNFPQLTKTEREVATLAKLGLGPGETAQYLAHSIHTTENHRSNIRKKLHLAERADLCIYFNAKLESLGAI